ncbi:MAG: diguanylate cyclase [Thiobacillus sp.]|nr:diguanylate cyclase [Thiobacillus sp.]
MSHPLSPSPPDSAAAYELESERLHAILATSHEAGVGMNANGMLTHWNHVAEMLFGWTADEVIGQRLADILIPERFRDAHHTGLAHFHATGNGPLLNRTMLVQALHRDGHELSLQVTLTALPSIDRSCFIAFMHDSTARQLTEQELIEQAMQDPLTGLDNRRAFLLNLSTAMKRSRRSKQPMALLYMDIDHFKSINDSLGHTAGDALLQAFGERLRAHVRETDRVARLGGDEFTVILELLHDGPGAETVANKLVRAMAERFELPEQVVRITTSIGLEVYEGGTVDTDHLISRADQAMYRAKRSGRNTWRAFDDTQPVRAPVPDNHERLREFVGRSRTETHRRDFLDNALAAIRTHLGMDVAFISEFTDGQRMFRHVDSETGHAPIAVGEGGPLEESYCQRVVDGRLPELIPDAFAEPEAVALSATRDLPVRAHLSVPIRLANGDIYGTFCCFSPHPDASLNERDIALLRIFADLTARHIEQHG